MLFNITSGAFCSPQAGEAPAVAPIEGASAGACRLGTLLPKQQATMRGARRQARPRPCPQPCAVRPWGHSAAPTTALPNKRTARACRTSAMNGKLLTMRGARRQARPRPCPQPCAVRPWGHYAAPTTALPSRRTARACRVPANHRI